MNESYRLKENRYSVQHKSLIWKAGRPLDQLPLLKYLTVKRSRSIIAKLEFGLRPLLAALCSNMPSFNTKPIMQCANDINMHTVSC